MGKVLKSLGSKREQREVVKMLRRKGLYVIIGLLVIASLAVAPAFAATDSASHTVSFNNRGSVQLTLDQADINLGDVDPDVAQQSAADALTATVKSNGNWTLNVKGDASFSDGGVNTIPIGRLEWDADDFVSPTTMTTTDAQVATGSKTGGAGQAVGMEYQLTTTYDDEAANGYQANITYTATTP